MPGCPYCAADPGGHRFRDDDGAVWHMLGNWRGHTEPCLNPERATAAEIRDELRNEIVNERDD